MKPEKIVSLVESSFIMMVRLKIKEVLHFFKRRLSTFFAYRKALRVTKGGPLVPFVDHVMLVH
jgi:hypothetical protein